MLLKVVITFLIRWVKCSDLFRTKIAKRNFEEIRCGKDGMDPELNTEKMRRVRKLLF